MSMVSSIGFKRLISFWTVLVFFALAVLAKSVKAA